MHKKKTNFEFDDLLMNESLITKKNEKLLKTFVSYFKAFRTFLISNKRLMSFFLFPSESHHRKEM